MSEIKIKRYGNEKTMELREKGDLKYLVFPSVETDAKITDLSLHLSSPLKKP